VSSALTPYCVFLISISSASVRKLKTSDIIKHLDEKMTWTVLKEADGHMVLWSKKIFVHISSWPEKALQLTMTVES
jgi:hypothetical protein